jgi:peroxisomal membrane anchor protein 14 (PEX14)
MAKDEKSIPTWQKPVSQQSDSVPANDGLSGDIQYTEVEEMPPIPTRKEAAAFLEHPGTKDADAIDKIRFLELKQVQRNDIEALIPEAKKYYAKVSTIEINSCRHSNYYTARRKGKKSPGRGPQGICVGGWQQSGCPACCHIPRIPGQAKSSSAHYSQFPVEHHVCYCRCRRRHVRIVKIRVGSYA